MPRNDERDQALRAIKAAVRVCVGTKMDVSSIRKMPSFTGYTYVLHFRKQTAGLHGLVTRLVPADSAREINAAIREKEFLREVQHQPEHCSFPRHIASFPFEDLEIFVTELLPGVPATEVRINRSLAGKAASAIRYVQKSLSATSTGEAMISGEGNVNDHYYRTAAHFLSKYFGLETGAEELAFLDRLESLRRQQPVIVSDRGPANFTVNGGNLCAFDFNLAFVGVPFEDWVWFIDDPRLNSGLYREELIDLFCRDFAETFGGNPSALTHDFHVASVFVNIKQYCLMLASNRVDSARHNLLCARASANESGHREAVELIRKLSGAPLHLQETI